MPSPLPPGKGIPSAPAEKKPSSRNKLSRAFFEVLALAYREDKIKMEKVFLILATKGIHRKEGAPRLRERIRKLAATRRIPGYSSKPPQKMGPTRTRSPVFLSKVPVFQFFFSFPSFPSPFFFGAFRTPLMLGRCRLRSRPIPEKLWGIVSRSVKAVRKSPTSHRRKLMEK